MLFCSKDLNFDLNVDLPYYKILYIDVEWEELDVEH